MNGVFDDRIHGNGVFDNQCHEYDQEKQEQGNRRGVFKDGCQRDMGGEKYIYRYRYSPTVIYVVLAALCCNVVKG